MRSAPLIGGKTWFAPRKVGWGFDPVSPEGWAVTAAAVLLSLKMKRSEQCRRHERALFGSLVLVMFLKGSSPGGPGARRAFDEAKVLA